MVVWSASRRWRRGPALATWSGVCLTVVLYGVNMLGAALRDLLDPRLAGAGGRVDRGVSR